MSYTEQANYITYIFAQMWRYFEIQTPLFGLTTGQIVIGFFIISLIIKVFKSIFTPDMENSKDSGSGRVKND